MGRLSQLTTALSDRYHIERELGAGGMATVYVAADLRHRRKVAIKVLRAELAAAAWAAGLSLSEPVADYIPAAEDPVRTVSCWRLLSSVQEADYH